MRGYGSSLSAIATALQARGHKISHMEPGAEKSRPSPWLRQGAADDELEGSAWLLPHVKGGVRCQKGLRCQRSWKDPWPGWAWATGRRQPRGTPPLPQAGGRFIAWKEETSWGSSLRRMPGS